MWMRSEQSAVHVQFCTPYSTALQCSESEPCGAQLEVTSGPLRSTWIDAVSHLESAPALASFVRESMCAHSTWQMALSLLAAVQRHTQRFQGACGGQ